MRLALIALVLICFLGCTTTVITETTEEVQTKESCKKDLDKKVCPVLK